MNLKKKIEKLHLICFCFENLPSKYIATIYNIITQPLIIRLTAQCSTDLTEQNVNKRKYFWSLSFDKVWLLKIALSFAVPCEIIQRLKNRKGCKYKISVHFFNFDFLSMGFVADHLLDSFRCSMILFSLFDVKLLWFSYFLYQVCALW